MQIVSITNFLTFLQSDYNNFLEKTKEEKTTILAKNQRIQNHVKSELPLRDLYVDLMMYDTLLSTDITIDVQERLLQNKNILQTKITQREKAGEVISPDFKVYEVSRQCQINPDHVISHLLPWVNDPEIFKKKAPKLLKNPQWPMEIMKYVVGNLNSKTHTVLQFRNLTRLIECMFELQNTP